MHDTDRPPLDPLAEEKIDQKLYEIDQEYWSLIRGFLAPGRIPPGNPLPPRRPQHLLDCVLRYAGALYAAELPCYEHLRGPHYPAWLSKLTERIYERVSNAVVGVEDANIADTLWYHGISLHEIQEALTQRLWELRTSDSFKDAGPHPAAESPGPESEKAATQEDAPQHCEPLSEQIRALKNECDLTAEELASALQVDTRSIQRHLAGDALPRRKHLAVYEEFFSKRLGRTVTLKRPHKRH